MRADQIATLMLQGMQAQGNGNGDIGWHSGTVLAYDETTGLNTVLIQGNQFNNLSVLSSSNTIMLQPGDVVGILRVQTQYFILGAIQAPGQGAALRLASASNTGSVSGINIPSWTDVPGSPGPTVSNVYIGSARRCIVFMSVNASVNNSELLMGVQVSGASSIAPGASFGNVALVGALMFGSTTVSCTVSSSASRTVVLTAADGLNQGFNTFASKYETVITSPGTGADVGPRVLSVLPF